MIPDHESLEITLKESAKGALDVKKAFTLTLPEGVYATNVEVTDPEGAYIVGEGTSTDADDIELHLQQLTRRAIMTTSNSLERHS